MSTHGQNAMHAFVIDLVNAIDQNPQIVIVGTCHELQCLGEDVTTDVICESRALRAETIETKL